MEKEKRIKLNDILDSIMETFGYKGRVYYQPPETIKLCYPCIIYKKSKDLNVYADAKKYKKNFAYTVIVIDREPDSGIAEEIDNLPYSTFSNHNIYDKLHHFSYTVYI